MSQTVKLPQNRIREIRGEQNLTLEKLGDLMGCHWTTVARHQRGENITAAVMQRYAEIFGVPVIDLYVNPNHLPGSRSASE